MELIDIYKYLVGGYYGVGLIDEYNLKVFVQKDIENYIKGWLIDNDLSNYNLEDINNDINDNMDEITKLQDALLVLHKINGPIDLILIIKQRISYLNEID